MRSRYSGYPVFPTWEIRMKALYTCHAMRAFPKRESLITTQHVCLLLGVLKVKLILVTKVKKSTLLEEGRREKEIH
jgi:hypothetical protein